MGKCGVFCRRLGKRFKRCGVNFCRCMKRVCTCRGRMPRCCRKCCRKCKKSSCWAPLCRRCNLCEKCKKCTKWASRCVCKPRRTVRRVPHTEYYKVKKRRRSDVPENTPEDRNQVYYFTVNALNTEDEETDPGECSRSLKKCKKIKKPKPRKDEAKL